MLSLLCSLSLFANPSHGLSSLTTPYMDDGIVIWSAVQPPDGLTATLQKIASGRRGTADVLAGRGGGGVIWLVADKADLAKADRLLAGRTTTNMFAEDHSGFYSRRTGIIVVAADGFGPDRITYDVVHELMHAHQHRSLGWDGMARSSRVKALHEGSAVALARRALAENATIYDGDLYFRARATLDLFASDDAPNSDRLLDLAEANPYTLGGVICEYLLQNHPARLQAYFAAVRAGSPARTAALEVFADLDVKALRRHIHAELDALPWEMRVGPWSFNHDVAEVDGRVREALYVPRNTTGANVIEVRRDDAGGDDDGMVGVVTRLDQSGTWTAIAVLPDGSVANFRSTVTPYGGRWNVRRLDVPLPVAAVALERPSEVVFRFEHYDDKRHVFANDKLVQIVRCKPDTPVGFFAAVGGRASYRILR